MLLVCGHFPLSYFHTLLKKVWPHPFAYHTLDIYKHWSDPLRVFFFQGWIDPGHSAFPLKRGAPGPLSSSWLTAGLFPGDSCLFCTGEPRTGHKLQVRPDQGRVEGEDHLPWPAGHAPFNTPKDAIGLLCHQGTLLAHGESVAHQDPQVPLCRVPLQHIIPNLYWCMRYSFPRCKTTLTFVKSYLVPLCPTLQLGIH